MSFRETLDLGKNDLFLDAVRTRNVEKRDGSVLLGTLEDERYSNGDVLVPPRHERRENLQVTK